MGGANPAEGTPDDPTISIEKGKAVGLPTSRRDLPFTDKGCERVSLLAGFLEPTFADDGLPETPDFFSAQRGGFRPGVGHMSRLTGVTGSDTNGRVIEA